MTHMNLRRAYNKERMSDDGPQDDSIDATTFQVLTSNGASCLLEMLVIIWGLAFAMPLLHFPDLLIMR